MADGMASRGWCMMQSWMMVAEVFPWLAQGPSTEVATLPELRAPVVPVLPL